MSDEIPMLSTSSATQMGDFSYRCVRISHLGSEFLFDIYILCIEKNIKQVKMSNVIRTLG
jgi:hypothetical protein